MKCIAFDKGKELLNIQPNNERTNQLALPVSNNTVNVFNSLAYSTCVWYL